jgi:hypothetical protein
MGGLCRVELRLFEKFAAIVRKICELGNRPLASCSLRVLGRMVASQGAYMRWAVVQHKNELARADAVEFGSVLQKNWEGGLLVARSVEKGRVGPPQRPAEFSAGRQGFPPQVRRMGGLPRRDC